jgi:hypothetical protein
MTDVTERERPTFLATVTVYGAGIAGLTAAHELMERGFRVRVVECDHAPGPDGRVGPALGGLARSQYVGGVKFMSHRWWEEPESAATPRVVPAGPALELAFAEGSSELSDDARERLATAARSLARRFRPGYQVTARASAAEAADAGAGDSLAAARAARVREELLSHGTDVRPEDIRLQVTGSGPAAPAATSPPPSSAATPAAEGGAGGAAPAGMETESGTEPAPEAKGADEAARLELVTVQPVHIILAGEHGFHFFPGYYRHLFDTMRRTPLVDADGEETGHTVYDNIVIAPTQGIATRFTERDGYNAQDVEQFQLRILRYLTTCPRRRAAEFENISWWQYLIGYDPATGGYLYDYTPAFQRDVRFAGRVLAAFDADWGDARTNGDTYVQLSMEQWSGQPSDNGLLNGPETETWFMPWRAYLESRGVRFVSARLVGFELEDGEVRARIQHAGEMEAVLDEETDYYVSATDVVSAEEVTRALPPTGVPGSLRGYTTVVPPSPETPAGTQPAAPIIRDPRASPGLRPWDRLQTLSGVQYFFTSEFKLVDGYVYFADAEWALSSINPQQFWTRRPSLERDGYVSVLSIDIGNWNVPSTHPPLGGRTAWQCTEQEVAEEVWRQVTTSLLRSTRDLVLPQPVWYNVDRNIIYRDTPPGPAVRNLTPYQIPIVADWKNRPVGSPWDPTPQLPGNAERLPPEPGVWQAEHGGYVVHWDRLVFAGTYMRTFTRMTTMESANESARHAVNAIIDHVVYVRYAEEIERGVMPPSTAPALPSNFTRRYPRPSPVGDYCQIWNPEQNEVESLAPPRAYDDIRFQLGLPHVWDSLGVEVLPSLLSKLRAAAGGASVPVEPMAPERMEGMDASSILETLTRVREQLEGELRAAATAPAAGRG